MKQVIEVYLKPSGDYRDIIKDAGKFRFVLRMHKNQFIQAFPIWEGDIEKCPLGFGIIVNGRVIWK